MSDETDRASAWPLSAEREAASAAVWGAGWLTGDAHVNARIWRSVQAALDAYEDTMRIRSTLGGNPE